MFANLNYFNLHSYHTDVEIIECNNENENNMIYLQKSANNHCKKYNIFVHNKFFVSMAIILIALSINPRVPKLENPTPI